MGNKFVVADPARCIGCKTCMAACLMKHDVAGDVADARLRVTQTYDVSAPVACHHCVDAPCAAACPTGALYEDPAHGRVAVREESCIGCRSCVMACPFGAVHVDVRSEAVRMGNLFVGTRSKAMVVKCDLCVDREGGPACIEACPTKGLTLMDDAGLERLAAARRTSAVQA
ncbi:4Fe-4S dicluster domain-containing protein [bacterium]|nr:4Fe-4S dicluster domain-containing protein [bacterium]